MNIVVTTPSNEHVPNDRTRSTASGFHLDRDCPADDGCNGQNVENVYFDGIQPQPGHYSVDIVLVDPHGADPPIQVRKPMPASGRAPWGSTSASRREKIRRRRSPSMARSPPAWLLAPTLCLSGAVRLHGGWGVAYPPADAGAPRPAIVYLHGMWASPEDSCGLFERSATAFGFLVCPRGNAPLGDGKMWTGSYATVAPNVRAALDAAGKQGPGPCSIALGGGTLMGYSNGAYFAAEVAMAEPGRWTGLVLLSMRLELDVARLKAAGVKRVVLGAADKDGARDSMKALADQRTDAAGLPTRFVSLGPSRPASLPRGHRRAHVRRPSRWVREADPAASRRGRPERGSVPGRIRRERSSADQQPVVSMCT